MKAATKGTHSPSVVLFRENLKLLLRHRKMRVVRIAEATGMRLNGFLNGQKSISFETADRIAKFMGEDLSLFLFDSEQFKEFMEID